MRIVFILTLILLILPCAMVSQDAPVTTAGRVTDAVPGNPAVPVPVTVEDFTGIGQFTLTMKFDTTRVRYVSAATNASLPGMTVTYNPPAGNTQGKLVFAWSGATNVSLADGASLADLTFHYVNGTGILSWAYTFGDLCQYKSWSGNSLIALVDNPKHQFYLNGGISNRAAPLTRAPVVAGPATGALPLPVITDEFDDITSLTLYLEYDPAFITYQGTFTKHPSFDSNFLVGDNPGFNGKRFMVIQWYGSPVSLPDGSVLCTLHFTRGTPSCDISPLSWYDPGPNCEFTGGSGDVLIDMPREDYYSDGLLGPGLPSVWTGTMSSNWNEPGNWNACGIPDSLRQVVIPDVTPNAFPVVNTTVRCRSISIESGATLQISPSGILTVKE